MRSRAQSNLQWMQTLSLRPENFSKQETLLNQLLKLLHLLNFWITQQEKQKSYN